MSNEAGAVKEAVAKYLRGTKVSWQRAEWEDVLPGVREMWLAVADQFLAEMAGAGFSMCAEGEGRLLDKKVKLEQALERGHDNELEPVWFDPVNHDVYTQDEPVPGDVPLLIPKEG